MCSKNTLGAHEVCMLLTEKILNLGKVLIPSNALNFLLILLITDSLLFFFHCLQATPLLDNPLFSLENNQGYPEMFQYIKELWIIILLLFVFNKTKVTEYTLWALLFFYMLLDDSLRINEKLGRVVAENMGFTSFIGLQPVDFGELIVMAFLALFLLTPLFLFYVKSPDSPFKKASKDLFFLFLVLVFFGIIVDILHIMLSGFGGVVNYLMASIEEGGEMLVMSFIAWYVYLLDHRNGIAIDLLLKIKEQKHKV
jgi:hypothetical protein